MSPKHFIPHDYQVNLIEFLLTHKRSAVFCPMGGGKSVTTLSALDSLSLTEDVYPVLIIAPLRVAKTTWPDEIAKWYFTKHLKVTPIVGSVKERTAAVKTKSEVYTTNYESLPWLIEFYGDAWPFKTVVADELTKLKSFRTRQGSKRAKALGRIAHTKIERFIGLTGTPSPNGLADLWGQLWFVDRGKRLGSSFSAFENRWFTKGYDGFSIKPLPHAQKEIEELIRDVCITVKGLPVDEPIENVIYVDLPKKAREIYDEMEKEMFAEIEDIGVEALNAAAKTVKCQQIAAGSLITDETGKWSEIHDEKIDALRSVVEEAAGNPVLVAYKFKADLQRLKAAFPQGRALDADPATIHQWNEGGIPILFAHPSSSGHGITLAEGGNILAYFNVDWNLETHMQIVERIGPMRQKQLGLNRPVFVHYIIARKTVDEMILDRLTNKKSVQEALLDAMRKRKSK